MIKYNLVPFDIYIFSYINEWYKMIYPKNKNIKNRIFIILIHILHILIIFLNLLGAFLPPKYLIYYIIFTFLLFSSWYICLQHCPLTCITNYIDNSYYDFLPLTNLSRLSLLYILLLWSIIGFYVPNLSLFRILNNSINYIAKHYDN